MCKFFGRKNISRRIIPCSSFARTDSNLSETARVKSKKGKPAKEPGTAARRMTGGAFSELCACAPDYNVRKILIIP